MNVTPLLEGYYEWEAYYSYGGHWGIKQLCLGGGGQA